MKKAWPIVVLFIALVECAFFSSGPDPESPEKEITNRIVIQVDSLSSLITNQFLPEAQKRDANPQKLRELFRQSRLAYKKFEWSAEYFNGKITRTVNGPPVPESELSGFIQQPGGLQVIEGYLYPQYNAGKRGEIIRELKLLLFNCNSYRSYYQHANISKSQVWDAAKLEIFRVLTLGIAGFDAPLAKTSISESVSSLCSLNKVLAGYGSDSDLKLKFNKAICYLEADTAFINFDRAIFLTAYGNPLTTTITRAQQALSIPLIQSRRLLRQNASTLFDADAFDASAYSAYPDDKSTAYKIALGKKLFNEPLLSGAGITSCASCHQPGKAFTDGLVKNKASDGHSMLLRNTPTLLNAAFQPAQFADMRENTLEGQANDVMENNMEMDGSIKKARAFLTSDAFYKQLFAEAYPQTKSTGITRQEITGALAIYIQTLSILNSRFDEYMRGNETALNAEEVKGFNVFMGKAKCGTCHYMPLFNGAIPPSYTSMDAEVLGVSATSNGRELDKDLGRNAITHASTDNYSFKIPTVRNAARTAPYMHNGAFSTLEDVIEFYNKGGGAGQGINVPNQTLSRQPLELSDKEKQELIAFIKSLDNR